MFVYQCTAAPMRKLFRFLFGKPSQVVTLSQTLGVHNCPNCGAHLKDKYCSHCGQKRNERHDFRISHFLGETVHAFTHFDTKFFTTLRYLFTRPGYLTLEFIRGHRKKYMNPVQIFLISNIVYFIFPLFDTFTTELAIHMDGPGLHATIRGMVEEKIKKDGISYTQYETEFNEHEKGKAKTLIILMIPIFAVFFSAMFLRQKRFFTEQLVFTLHFFSFLLIFGVVGVSLFYIIIALVAKLLIILGVGGFAYDMFRFFKTDDGISSFLVIVFFTYFFISIKMVYSQSNAEGVIKSLISLCLLFYTVQIYRFILFFATFYGLRVELH
jgi:hypothetical protein